MLGSLFSAAWTSLCVLVFHSLTGLLITVYLQPGQFRSNSFLMVSTVPGLGRMSAPPISRVFALPPESLMIQSAAAVPATLKGAVTRAVTPAAQPSHAGGVGDESS